MFAFGHWCTIRFQFWPPRGKGFSTPVTDWLRPGWVQQYYHWSPSMVHFQHENILEIEFAIHRWEKTLENTDSFMYLCQHKEWPSVEPPMFLIHSAVSLEEAMKVRKKKCKSGGTGEWKDVQYSSKDHTLFRESWRWVNFSWALTFHNQWINQLMNYFSHTVSFIFTLLCFSPFFKETFSFSPAH